MFANTLSVTIDAVAYSLLRNNQDNFGSVYQYKDGTRIITMRVRHSTDKVAGIDVNRHNVTLEHRIFATPTTAERYFTCTATLRERFDSDPTMLLKTWQGFNTLLLTLDDTLVLGDN
jgi:hypothetical protein